MAPIPGNERSAAVFFSTKLKRDLTEKESELNKLKQVLDNVGNIVIL